jgi:hypothetical protein
MPHWFVVALIVFIAAPGAAIVLFGVYALFRASGPGAPVAESGAPPAEPEGGTPLPPNFGESPVADFPTMAPPISTQVDEVIDIAAAPVDAETEPVIDAEIADPLSDPLLPPPGGTDDKDVT